MTRPLHVTLLVDWHVRTEPYWLCEELRRAGFSVDMMGVSDASASYATGALGHLVLWTRWAALGVRGARHAERAGGAVLAWSFVIGAFASVWSRLRGEKGAPVVALNMIAHDQGALRGAIRRLIYHVALGNPRMRLTVNSPELRELYVRRFGVPASRTNILRDCWKPHYARAAPEEADDGFIFAGGRGGRDWPTLIAVARLCPDLAFQVVAGRGDWPTPMSVPDNMTVEFDIPEDEFYARACRARVIVVPLLSGVTSGLIVLLRCALLGRVVVSTDTPATAAYYPEACRHLLTPIGDADSMAATIVELWKSTTARFEAARAQQEYILAEFPPQGYAKSISELLERMRQT